MTNNPTIDGVSRRLLELSAQCLSNSGYEMAHAELRALLAAPVVERQESVVFGYVIPGSFPVVSGYTSTANPVNEGKYTQPVYTAPPQLAELQNMTELAMSRGDRVDALRLQVSELQATIERQAVLLRHFASCADVRQVGTSAMESVACLDATAALNGEKPCH